MLDALLSFLASVYMAVEQMAVDFNTSVIVPYVYAPQPVTVHSCQNRAKSFWSIWFTPRQGTIAHYYNLFRGMCNKCTPSCTSMTILPVYLSKWLFMPLFYFDCSTPAFSFFIMTFKMCLESHLELAPMALALMIITYYLRISKWQVLVPYLLVMTGWMATGMLLAFVLILLNNERLSISVFTPTPELRNSAEDPRPEPECGKMPTYTQVFLAQSSLVCIALKVAGFNPTIPFAIAGLFRDVSFNWNFHFYEILVTTLLSQVLIIDIPLYLAVLPFSSILCGDLILMGAEHAVATFATQKNAVSPKGARKFPKRKTLKALGL